MMMAPSDFNRVDAEFASAKNINLYRDPTVSRTPTSNWLGLGWAMMILYRYR
jgi:hypothetical protein